MFTIDKYVLAESPEQAYQLNQAPGNKILGGTMWLRLSNRKIDTAIDLSALGLNKIEEDSDCFKLGCMCSLRDIETDARLQERFRGFLSSSVQHIVGVQFRNGATLGGSVYSRFPFSDLLTALLALDTEVELYRGGRKPLADFLKSSPDKDILIGLSIKKDRHRAFYTSQRLSYADFPIINCAVSEKNNAWKVVLGCRPGRAVVTEFSAASPLGEEDINKLLLQIEETVEFGANNRAGKEYRELLAKVLVRRCLNEISGGYRDAN